MDIAVGAREGTVAFAGAVRRRAGRGAGAGGDAESGQLGSVGQHLYRGHAGQCTTVPVRNRDPLLRVANATVREGPQAQLQFQRVAGPRGSGDGDGGLRDVGRDGDRGGGLHGDFEYAELCRGRDGKKRSRWRCWTMRTMRAPKR